VAVGRALCDASSSAFAGPGPLETSTHAHSRACARSVRTQSCCLDREGVGSCCSRQHDALLLSGSRRVCAITQAIAAPKRLAPRSSSSLTGHARAGANLRRADHGSFPRSISPTLVTARSLVRLVNSTMRSSVGEDLFCFLLDQLWLVRRCTRDSHHWQSMLSKHPRWRRSLQYQRLTRALGLSQPRALPFLKGLDPASAREVSRPLRVPLAVLLARAKEPR
jgi:hypothetical protein